MRTLFVALIFIPGLAAAGDSIQLYPGFVTKVACEGKLLVSAVGNDAAVKLEALPKELGCGVLLQPKQERTRTNLILETSTGTIRRIVVIGSFSQTPTASDLVIEEKAQTGGGQ